MMLNPSSLLGGLNGASCLPAALVLVLGMPYPSMGLEKDAVPLLPGICCQCLALLFWTKEENKMLPAAGMAMAMPWLSQSTLASIEMVTVVPWLPVGGCPWALP